MCSHLELGCASLVGQGQNSAQSSDPLAGLRAVLEDHPPVQLDLGSPGSVIPAYMGKSDIGQLQGGVVLVAIDQRLERLGHEVEPRARAVAQQPVPGEEQTPVAQVTRGVRPLLCHLLSAGGKPAVQAAASAVGQRVIHVVAQQLMIEPRAAGLRWVHQAVLALQTQYVLGHRRRRPTEHAGDEGLLEPIAGDRSEFQHLPVGCAQRTQAIAEQRNPRPMAVSRSRDSGAAIGRRWFRVRRVAAQATAQLEGKQRDPADPRHRRIDRRLARDLTHQLAHLFGQQPVEHDAVARPVLEPRSVVTPAGSR